VKVGVSKTGEISLVPIVLLVRLFQIKNMKVLLFLRTLYPTNTVLFIVLLLLSLLVSKVTTFKPLDWVKDVIEYEHCGSVWIKPDIYGKHDIRKHHDDEG